jgi:hypothetical protein
MLKHLQGKEMNERIRELMLEAGYAAPEIAGRGQLLAELIVRECADFADEHNDASEGVTLGVGRALKQHFGVEP